VQPPRATQPPTRPRGEKPIASPAVRRRAWELGIELQFVHGSGPAGRITNEDLDVYLASRGQPVAARGTTLRQRQGEEVVPVIGLRRKIAQKMQEAKRRIPHFSYVEEVDVTELEALRAQLNAKFGEQRGKLTVLPFIARAVVLALDEFPSTPASTTTPAWSRARTRCTWASRRRPTAGWPCRCCGTPRRRTCGDWRARSRGWPTPRVPARPRATSSRVRRSPSRAWGRWAASSPRP